ncbi:MAG TPA: TAT-variant-translocated molybdopterin oxidoreductase [Stellaceae bacterium]|nr:TAT-variant-translocated molybdopterin oxidoreductase [Stellaceae bacterium]
MTNPARDYWRSLEELADSPDFAAVVEREVPRFRDVLDKFDRRQFLTLMAASMALAGLSGCGPEPNPQQRLPYVEAPPGVVPGRQRYYATAHTRDGYAEGVLLAHEMARPIKVEGNPDHPASLGAAGAITQASILSLYNPRRAQTVVGPGQISSWEGFVAALYRRREQLLKKRGEGLRLLTGTITSPSLGAQIAALQTAFPAMRWHQWEPLHRDNELAADQMAYGRPVARVFDLAAADVIFAVDSDLISAAPGWLAYARQFAARRRPDETGGKMSRVYAIESTPTLIGAKADHRLPMRPVEVAASVRFLAGAVGAGPSQWTEIQSPHRDWLKEAAADLTANKGHALVHAGREQSIEIHLLVELINAALGAHGNTVRLIEPPVVSPTLHLQSLSELVGDMQAGKVDTLLILDTNPAYSAPADIPFAAALKRVPFSVSLSLFADESALLATWQVPAKHEYEAWGDARAFDGTATIQQPQVRPLYGGHAPSEVLAVLQGNTQPDDLTLVRQFWQRQQGAGSAAEGNPQSLAGDAGGGQTGPQSSGSSQPALAAAEAFEAFWHEALRRGVVANTAAPPLTLTPKAGLAEGLRPLPLGGEAAIDLLFRPDEGLWDGRHAENPWLLELARTFTRLTWDNAALIAPATAKKHGVKTGDVVAIATRYGATKAPVFVLPGQAPDTATLWLGWGRQAGALAEGVGFDAYRLRGAAEPWLARATRFEKTGETYRLATTQGHDRVAGRDLIREFTLDRFNNDPEYVKQKSKDVSLYPGYIYPDRAWAMAIDLNSCIGCQACTIACQAENNVPTVGKDMVHFGRIMHWLRIDRYYSGSPDDPDVAFEPMPCMHCENAPCEVVCPVHATVHDHEGLNLMVYNRCVGTRFCSNNCPYKVRRFNFYDFAAATERPPESWNPDVSVRGRGVMEKCTYCIQRIKVKEIEAERDGRKLRDGEVVTACQQSCPTQAIVFGDRNDSHSHVARRKATPLDYVLLDDLNTRPRTSYAAIVHNPNPAIGKEQS